MLLLFVDLLLRSAAIVSAGFLLWRLCRGWSPQNRHFLLFVTFVALAAEPVLYLCFPHFGFRWSSHHAQVSTWSGFRSYSSPAPARSSFSSVSYAPLCIYLAGMFLAVARVLNGWREAHILIRKCTRAPEPCQRIILLLAHKEGITPVPALLVSPRVSTPFACGIRQIAVVLPSDSEQWPETRLQSVLLHELGHLQRHDVAKQLFASLVSAIWWFQPMCWLLNRQLRAESEAASDEHVLRAGVRASEYAADLLAIAGRQLRRHPLPAAAIGMAREHGLARRVAAVLTVREPRTVSRPLVCATVLALAAFALSASAVTAETPESSPKGGLYMKRAMIAGLFAAAGLSGAATISGTVYDNTGAALPNVKVVLSNPDNSSGQDATTNSGGRFDFANLAAGEYILRVQQSGYATLLREFHLEANTDVERNLRLQLSSNNPGGVSNADAQAPQDQQNSKPLRVGGRVEQANLVNKVQPVYPSAAKSAGIQGTVQIEAIISKEGVPEELRVVSSPSDDLSESALEAVRQWRYRPVLLNGNPVSVVTDIIVNYTLAP